MTNYTQDNIESKGHVIDSYVTDTYFFVKGISGDTDSRTKAFYDLKNIFSFKAGAVTEGTVGYAQYVDWEKNEAYIAFGEMIAPYGRATFHIHIIILDLSIFEKINCNMFRLDLKDIFITHEKLLQLIKEKKIEENLPQKLKVFPLPTPTAEMFLKKQELRSMMDAWLIGARKFYVSDSNIAIGLGTGLIEMAGGLSFSVNLPPAEEVYFDPIILSVLGPATEVKGPQPLTDILISDKREIVNELFMSLRIRPASYLRKVNAILASSQSSIEDIFVSLISEDARIRVNYQNLWNVLFKGFQQNMFRVFNDALKAMNVNTNMLDEDEGLVQVLAQICSASTSTGMTDITNLHPLNELLGYYKHKINDEYFDDTAAAWPNDVKQKEILKLLRVKNSLKALSAFDQESILNAIRENPSVLSEDPSIIDKVREVAKNEIVVADAEIFRHFLNWLSTHPENDLMKLINEGYNSSELFNKASRAPNFTSDLKSYFQLEGNFNNAFLKLMYVLLHSDALDEKAVKKIDSAIRETAWFRLSNFPVDAQLFFREVVFLDKKMLPVNLWFDWLRKHYPETIPNIQKEVLSVFFEKS